MFANLSPYFSRLNPYPLRVRSIRCWICLAVEQREIILQRILTLRRQHISASAQNLASHPESEKFGGVPEESLILRNRLRTLFSANRGFLLSTKNSTQPMETRQGLPKGPHPCVVVIREVAQHQTEVEIASTIEKLESLCPHFLLIVTSPPDDSPLSKITE